jgi:hypothetical protein
MSDLVASVGGMEIDVHAAEQFVLANARLLDRHRLARLLHNASPEPVLRSLRAYRNDDGGFGHALEPDVRSPHSETTSTLHALEVLSELGRLDDPMVDGATQWLASVADADGGVPFVLPSATASPRAPWMVSSEGGSHLTFAFAAVLWAAGSSHEWLARGTDWCWTRLEGAEPLNGYLVKFALGFIDHVPDADRAAAALERLRPALEADGCLPVPGGTVGERLTPVTLSPRPGSRSRTLFTAAQIDTDLDALAAGQRDDGGWMFDWLAWSPGQTVEWRGALTVGALQTLGRHGRR